MSVEFLLVYTSECGGGSIVENELLNLLACYSFLFVTAISIRNVHPILDMESTQTLDNATFTFCTHSLSLEKPKHVYLSLLFTAAEEAKVVCVLKSKQTKTQLENKPPYSYVKLLCLVAV